MITQLDASKDPECRCPILHLRQFLSTPIRDYIPATVEPKDKVEGNCTLEEINDNVRTLWCPEKNKAIF